MVGSLVENLDADAEDVTEAFVSFVVATLRRHARSRRSRRRFGRRADTAVAAVAAATAAPGPRELFGGAATGVARRSPTTLRSLGTTEPPSCVA